MSIEINLSVHSFFVHLSAANNIRNTAYNYLCPWLHPPIGSTSDKRTVGKKRHKG